MAQKPTFPHLWKLQQVPNEESATSVQHLRLELEEAIEDRQLFFWSPKGNLESNVVENLGGGNPNIFGIFTPKIGEDEPILTNIFQMGWNHHLEIYAHITFPETKSEFTPEDGWVRRSGFLLG